MKKFFLLISLMILGFMAVAQTSPLKMVNFHKLPNEIADLKALKDEADRDCDYDGHKAALIRVKAQGFNEKNMLDFNTFPRPGIEIIHKKYKDGEMWLYVSSGCQGTIVIKYMGEFEFKLPSKLDAKGVYELVLGMETATLVIRAIPSEAEIFIDNQKVGTGYASKSVSIGMEHHYKVQCADYWPREGQVYFDQRDEKSLNIELEPNFGYITIKSEPAGADVYVDDVKVGVTPYMMKKIKLGSRVVELRKTGFETYADMVTVKSNEVNKQLENVKLTAVRVPMGSLELASNPTGAIITINGHQYGQTPKTLTDFKVGTYTIYFSKEGYENLTQTVTVKDGKKETLNVTLSKTSVPQQQVQSVSSNVNNSIDSYGHQWVDLGLPSGTLWATCDIGATKPEDRGYYFAWGETEPKSIYNWSTYKYCKGSEKTITKYCNNTEYGYNGYRDGITVLQPEDDAAIVYWGRNWRMPTKAEWDELYKHTNHRWTTQNGVFGRIYTANNGNSIFLPAVGWYDSNYHNYKYDVYRWSSSLVDDVPRSSWSIGYYVVETCLSPNWRYRGFPIRPVRAF